MLRGHRRRQREERLAWGPAYQDSGYVITNKNGAPLHTDRITVLFTRHRKTLGLPSVRFHIDEQPQRDPGDAFVGRRVHGPRIELGGHA